VLKKPIAGLGLIAILGILCLPAHAALQPLQEGYWMLPGGLTADTEASLRDLLKNQPADSIFQALGVSLVPATWGGDEAAQVRVANRIVADYPGKLILVTPTVGTQGWEDSNTVGGAAGPGAPQTQAQWLQGLEGYKGDRVGLVISTCSVAMGLQGPHSQARFLLSISMYVHDFTTWCHAHGKTCVVWLPAELLADRTRTLALTDIASAGAKVDRWVWDQAPEIADVPAAPDLPALLKEICAITPANRVVLQYSTGARGTDTPSHAEAYMAAAQAAGIDRFAVSASPQDMTAEWAGFFQGLSLVPPPASIPARPCPPGGG
jgi:hypothetical protein